MTTRSLFALLLAGLLVGACGTEEAPTRGADPAASSTAGGETPATPEMPTEIPAADGLVRSRFPAVVMDTGDGAELCLGPIAESYPPQCSGPPIPGWNWDDVEQGMFEKVGRVRWGTFALTGTWDGSAFGADASMPGPIHDPAPDDSAAFPEPSRDLSERELQKIADHLGATVPGAQSAWPDQGRVLLDVLYDDGTISAWADAEYGTGVVAVVSALVDAD